MAPKGWSPKVMGEQIAERIWYCCTESPAANLGSCMAFVERTPSPSIAALRMVVETCILAASSSFGGVA